MRGAWVVVLGVTAAAIAASLWWGPRVLRRFDFFAVRRVEVVGARFLAPETVVAALGEPASVFDDLGRLGRRLGTLAGVRTSKVTRRLPGTLVVEVSEFAPVGLAMGPERLVAVDGRARPLPYDVTRGGMDLPVVERADSALLAALAAVQATDLDLFAAIVGARSVPRMPPPEGRGNPPGLPDLIFELAEGRVRVASLAPEVVRAVAVVRRDLVARHRRFSEIDGRFAGQVVVR